MRVWAATAVAAAAQATTTSTQPTSVPTASTWTPRQWDLREHVHVLE